MCKSWSLLSCNFSFSNALLLSSLWLTAVSSESCSVASLCVFLHRDRKCSYPDHWHKAAACVLPVLWLRDQGHPPMLATMSGMLSQDPWRFSTPQLGSGECCSAIWHSGITPCWFYTTNLCPIAPGNCVRNNFKHFQKSIYSKCKILSIHHQVTYDLRRGYCSVG